MSRREEIAARLLAGKPVWPADITWLLVELARVEGERELAIAEMHEAERLWNEWRVSCQRHRDLAMDAERERDVALNERDEARNALNEHAASALAERERCAKVCSEHYDRYAQLSEPYMTEHHCNAAQEIEAAIRRGGE